MPGRAAAGSARREQPRTLPRISTVHPTALATLKHGQFFGARSHQRTAPGYELAELVPTIPPEEVARHTHLDAHFVLLIDGVYLSSAAGAPPAACSPLLIYNPPATTHRDRFHSLNGRFFTISVATSSLRRVSEYALPPQRPTAFQDGRPLALARRLVAECRRWDMASPLAAEGLCIELMAEITRLSERRHRHPPHWLRNVEAMLRDPGVNGLGLTEIARAAGVHPIHLARTFREFYDCPPAEYRRRCRLDRAAALLTQPSVSIAAVALEAGFADQSHFSKAFRHAFTLSPRQYRRAHVCR